MIKAKQKRRTFLSAVAICAILLPMLYGAPMQSLMRVIATPEFAAAMLFWGTGRVVPLPEDTDNTPEPTPAPPAATPLEFTQADLALLEFTNYAGVPFDPEALLLQPLTWELTGSSPTVLIYHTHTTESYENTENYTPSSPYRTLDSDHNMISVGKHLAQRLTEAGITVIHDTTIHDYPDYNAAYSLSRKTIKAYLAEYPSLCLVLDLHRDAYEDSSGHQATNTISIQGTDTARLMIVAGTNAAGEVHPDWQSNLALAAKLQAVLERETPGLCRPICIRSAGFNQMVSPGALLVEVGTAGDTRQDALAAADRLANAIIALAQGSQ